MENARLVLEGNPPMTCPCCGGEVAIQRMGGVWTAWCSPHGVTIWEPGCGWLARYGATC